MTFKDVFQYSDRISWLLVKSPSPQKKKTFWWNSGDSWESIRIQNLSKYPNFCLIENNGITSNVKSQELWSKERFSAEMNGFQRTACFAKGMHNYTFSRWTVHIFHSVIAGLVHSLGYLPDKTYLLRVRQITQSLNVVWWSFLPITVPSRPILLPLSNLWLYQNVTFEDLFSTSQIEI